ncbi:MAG: VanZ family protein, partial [Rikenellaceae bacterium]
MKIVTVSLTTLYVVLITVVLLLRMPNDIGLKPIEHIDKIVHFIIYLGLNVLLLTTLETLSCGSKRLSYIVATLLSVIYGICIELLQPFTGRGYEFSDIIANTVGASLG